jgi:hypothetical protein
MFVALLLLLGLLLGAAAMAPPARKPPPPPTPPAQKTARFLAHAYLSGKEPLGSPPAPPSYLSQQERGFYTALVGTVLRQGHLLDEVLCKVCRKGGLPRKRAVRTSLR